MSTHTEADIAFLRTAIALSESAVANGNHPFGSLLVGLDGSVVLTAENTVVTERDVSGHPEINLARAAADHGTPEELRRSTLYTSCEPCAMCSGAIFWAGIGRVVYAMDGTDLASIQGSGPTSVGLAVSCRSVLAGGSRPTDVVGPLIAAEARVPHLAFWVS